MKSGNRSEDIELGLFEYEKTWTYDVGNKLHLNGRKSVSDNYSEKNLTMSWM